MIFSHVNVVEIEVMKSLTGRFVRPKNSSSKDGVLLIVALFKATGACGISICA